MNKHHFDNRNKNPQKQEPLIDNDVLENILDGKDNSSLVKKAEDIAKVVKNGGLTTSQIRNIYGTVKKMEMAKWDETTIGKLLLLKPKIAYAAGRHGVNGLHDLRKVIDMAIDMVNKPNNLPEKLVRFDNFSKFFEAILAYHKAEGGK